MVRLRGEVERRRPPHHEGKRRSGRPRLNSRSFPLKPTPQQGHRSCQLKKLDFRAMPVRGLPGASTRSEEHTSELQSLIRLSYAVYCLKKQKSIKYYITFLTNP